MEESFMERVHTSLRGGYVKEYEVAGVENIFEKEAIGAKLYANAMDAYQRVCDRLGVIDEDDDLEIIVNSLLELEAEMSYRMYRYGAKFGMRDE